MSRGSRRSLAFVLILVFGVANMNVAALAAAIANPALLPGQILALRGGERNDQQLRLVFDRTENGTPAAPLKVDIGADYFTVIDGSKESIDDLKLHRHFIVDNDKKTLVNLSLFGEVMFRRVELLRRIRLAQSLAKPPNHPPLPQSLDRFWIESELGMTWRGRKEPAALVAQRRQGNKVQFAYHGQEVASFVPSGRVVPGGLGHSFLAFLRNQLPIHPRIIDVVAGGGEIPQRLQFISEAKGTGERIVLTLRQTDVVHADFPLPPHLTLVLVPGGTGDPDAALMRQVLPDMVNAIAGRANGGPRSITTYRVAIDRAIRHNHRFEAVLRLTELALQWGRDAAACDPGDGLGPCHSRREIDRLIHDDSRSTALFKAAALENSAPDSAIRVWRGVTGQDVPGDYVVDIFLARLLSQEGKRQAAAEAFVRAYAGDPYIPLLYRELGNHFARASRFDFAWLCYDLGRALPKRRDHDALEGIDEVEREMLRVYPDLL
ncbi:MAG: tetratricopeptide repeat protein [Stellaceae bacterium]